jgi:CRISPR/Cas system CSM-associated protein Csm2 small subunit
MDRGRWPAHVTTVEELRSLLRHDPEQFCKVLDELIAECDDDVTKSFWVNVKQFAQRSLRE